MDDALKNREDYLLKKVERTDQLMRYEVNSRTAKPIISLYLITGDIAEMITCIDTLIILEKFKPINLLMVSALWEKMIIAYGKIFSESKDGFSKLEYQQYFKEAGEITLHNEILKIRHSYLAHRGNNEFEYHIMLVDLVGTEQNCQLEFSVPGLKTIGNYFQPMKIKRHLKNLGKRVKAQLHAKMQKLEVNIYQELGLMPNLP